MQIGPIRIEDREELLAVAVNTGLFSMEDAEALLGHVLDELAGGRLGDGHRAIECRRTANDPVIGWCYYAPDAYSEKIWNVWWIGVLPESHGGGAGPALLAHVTDEAIQAGARAMVIETSDQAALERARRFYVKQGFEVRGAIPDFYAKGESKVIFSRSF